MTSKEEFLEGHFARQREISKKSIQIVADLAKANIDLINLNGLAQVEKKKMYYEHQNPERTA